MILLIQYIYILSGLLFLYFAISSSFNNYCYRQSIVVKYVGLSFFVACYTGNQLMKLQYPQFLCFNLLNPITAATSWLMYLLVIKSYVNLSSKVINFCIKAMPIFIAIFSLDLLYALISDQSILFRLATDNDFKIFIYQFIKMQVAPTTWGKIANISLTSFIFFSGIYCLYLMFHQSKKDYWLITGLIFILLFNSIDLAVNNQLLYYAIPLGMLGYLIEIIRFKIIFQKEIYSKLNKLGSELLKNSKLVELGMATANINHEVKNSLSIIKSSCLAIRQMDNLDDIKQMSNIIENQEQKILNIINSYSKLCSNNDSKNYFLLYDGISEIINLNKKRLEIEQIKVNIDIPKTQYIYFNPSNFSLIISNLLSNAIDALENQTNKWISIKATCKDNSTIIKFVDSGNGIQEELLPKIFERQFSTKTSDKGMGLGLFLVDEVLKAEGGSIEYAPNDLNTTFLVKILHPEHI